MCAQKKKDKKKKKDKDKKKKKDKDKEMRNLNDQCGSRGFIRVAEKFQKQDEFSELLLGGAGAGFPSTRASVSGLLVCPPPSEPLHSLWRWRAR
eukprot:249433-Rhodomonas_salina.2